METAGAKEIAEKLGFHLRQDLQSILKLFPILLILALLFTIVILDLSRTCSSQVTITATGRKMTTQAKAAVVWLAFPTVEYLHDQRFDIRKSMGWEIKNGLLISTRNHPAELQLTGRFSAGKAIQFFTTPYSGEIEIEMNGTRRIVNLFHARPEKEFIYPGHFLPKNEGTFIPVVFSFLALTAKHFSLLLILTLGLQGILPALPTPRVSANQWLLLLVVSIFVLFIVAFYPGVMSVDSYAQYEQAVDFSFSDWHPPMMSVVWSFINLFAPGAQGMFILDLFMATCSVYLLSRVALSKGKKLFFAPTILLLLPVVSCILFGIFKDVSLAVSLLFAFSLWYYWRSTAALNGPKLLLLLLVLFYASSVRHNALPAILPLIFMLVFDLTSKKKAVIFSILFGAFFFVAHNFIAYRILHTWKDYAYQVVLAHDLMGIYALTGKNYFTEDYLKKSTVDNLMKNFDHRVSDPTTFVEGFPLYTDRPLISILERQWLTAIVQNPAAYLTHRSILFRNFLTNFEHRIYPVYPVSDQPPKSLSKMQPPLFKETALGRFHTKFQEWSFNHYPFLFEGLTYLLLGVFILLMSLRLKIVNAAALSISSLLYIGCYFFFAPGVHYRYIYWAVFATLLSLFVLWIEKEDWKARVPESI